MGFNSMFGAFTGASESSDRIFTKAGVKIKFMQSKQPVLFSILPALDPNNPDKSTSCAVSILPDGSLSDWGQGAFVYRGIGHGDWKDRCDVVSLRTVGEECPIDMVYRAAKNDPAWSYIVEEGKWGDPNRQRAVIPACRQMLFCNVYLPNEAARVSHVGIFSKTIANKLIGENGLVFQPSMATAEQIAENYLTAYANGDITSPQGAPVLCIEKGHDKGEMSSYELKFALDANRRVTRTTVGPDVLATRVNINDVHEYLNILSADKIVDLLIRELNGRSPAGYHEHALLKIALGSRFRIPEPPPAPGAMHTVQSGFVAAPAQPQVAQASAPASQPQVVVTAAQPVQPVQPVQPAVPQPTVPTTAPTNEIGTVVQAAAVASAKPQAHVTGDPVPKFDKNAFIARLAGGMQ